MSIKKKSILITGASSGIGEATAYKAAQEGANLILCARNKQKLKAIKQKITHEYGVAVTTIKLDVRDKKSVAKLASKIAELGLSVDILINNAGLALGLEPIDQGDYENWEGMIDTNVKGLLYVTKEILPFLKQSDCGHIVNIGSLASYQVYPGGNVYNATKFAVKALSDAMSVDLVNENIKVSCVSPGAVNTNFASVRFKGDQDRADKVYEGYTPLVADDVADVIIYTLNAPRHVNIAHTLMLPMAQRNNYIVNRNGVQ
jgi:NADP-dependent 3-hydroxy acid dehydrogenase YdfG